MDVTVSDNSRFAMSKTPSDFGFLGDVNQTLKNWRFRAFTPYRASNETKGHHGL